MKACRIGVEGARYLSKALQSNTVKLNVFILYILIRIPNFLQTLINLHIAGNDIRIEGTMYLCEALQHNTVTFNSLLSKLALQFFQTLIELHISVNDIEADGVQYISEAFQCNTVTANLLIESHRNQPFHFI